MRRCSLSSPRTTILSASSGNGRCSVLRIQRPHQPDPSEHRRAAMLDDQDQRPTAMRSEADVNVNSAKGRFR